MVVCVCVCVVCEPCVCVWWGKVLRILVEDYECDASGCLLTDRTFLVKVASALSYRTHQRERTILPGA